MRLRLSQPHPSTGLLLPIRDMCATTALETIAVAAGIAAGTAADSARVAVAIAAAGAVADAFGAEPGAMVIVREAAICPLRNTPLQTRRIRHTRPATVRANPVLPRMHLSRSCCPVSHWRSTETARLLLR